MNSSQSPPDRGAFKPFKRWYERHCAASNVLFLFIIRMQLDNITARHGRKLHQPVSYIDITTLRMLKTC